MEAVEKTLIYRDDAGLYKKIHPGEKDKDMWKKDKEVPGETKSDESNYVELDNLADKRSESNKTVKVTFTGEGNRLSIIKSDALKIEDSRISSRDAVPGRPSDEPLLTKVPNTDPDSEYGDQQQTELDRSDCSDQALSESEELRYTDMYLNSRTESDDGASLVLSDHYGSDTVEDESHYITTHEIQLTELDHDVDYDLGRGTCWDFEDDNLVYSFVDYASFEGDAAHQGMLIVEGRGHADMRAQPSTEGQDESDICDSDKCACSDECVCKSHKDANAGQIHLSIQTSAWAVDDPKAGNLSKLRADRSLSFESSDAREGPRYFIPAPGRQHLATKLRRKDINEYSSGASSSVSELDDADKEVRNLTAKSFRSLACPYFDTINLRPSSESSLSEYGLNKWSAYMDLNYGKRGRSVIAHKTMEMSKSGEDQGSHAESIVSMRPSKVRMDVLDKRMANAQRQAPSGKKIQLQGPQQHQPGGVTLNIRCKVGVPESARRPKCSKNAQLARAAQTKSGRATQHSGDGVGDTQKRAIFASSLLKNVISKKMQFEQERKMERGEIRDGRPTLSPPPTFRDQDEPREGNQGQGLQRQTSETGSGFSVSSAESQGLECGRPASCELRDVQGDSCVLEKEELERRDCDEPPKAQLKHSQCSAFDSWKDGEPEAPQESETPVMGTSTKEGPDASQLLSQLFVPSSKPLSKEKDFTDASPGLTKSEEVSTSDGGNVVSKDEKEGEGIAPEIKICLRSVKENKGCTLNIASLLTPKIDYNTVNTFRAAAEPKCHFLTASEKIPNFTVRDIRENKCKFQMPIYHVRDVRKLVKSSYRFVSLHSGYSKSASDCLGASDKPEDKAKKEPIKYPLPSSIVIKCHSVKTNTNRDDAKTETSHKQPEAGWSSPKICPESPQCEPAPKHCLASKVLPKQLNPPDQTENLANPETKQTKQRQEKLPGEGIERRNEPAIPKQAALEKLQAAVKTMEQLYVFDRNEWKRRTQAPQPATHRQVLPPVARKEQGGGEERWTAAASSVSSRLAHPDVNVERVHQFPSSGPQSDTCNRGAVNIIHVPYSSDTFKTQAQQTFENRSEVQVQGHSKALGSLANSLSNNILQKPPCVKRSLSQAAPLSVRIEPPRRATEQVKAKSSAPNQADSENYLTIPGLAYTNELRLQDPEQATSSVSQGRTPPQHSSPLIVEPPASTVYHHPVTAAHALRPHLCLSPTVLAVSPTPPAAEGVPQTQRKMLLDPTTGHYYLVDTPMQATTKRLFDPETGQFVDVPMPHSPVTCVTPVPLSVSPLALSACAPCAPAYMICPGFVPSPTLSAQPRTACAKDATGEQLKHAVCSQQETNTSGAERVYYSATGEAAQMPLQLPVPLGHVTTQGGTASSQRRPVISITTQQGPRIIAPPSFDGTTMSFVVEHR